MFGFSSLKRIIALEAEVQQIKREVRELTVDLPELQRKMVRLLRNTARERARIEELDTHEMEATTAGPQPVAAPGGLLSERQKQIQQQILKRRAGG